MRNAILSRLLVCLGETSVKPTSARVGRDSTMVEAMSAEVGPMYATLGPEPSDFNHVWPDLGLVIDQSGRFG